MAHDHTPTTGQVITTFTFILFGLLLGLAAMAEPSPLKSAVLGTCAGLSLMGAARYKIAGIIAHWRQDR